MNLYINSKKRFHCHSSFWDIWNKMAKVALVGSSYVSRLEKFCEGDLKIPGEVKFFGVSGMRADNIPQNKINEILIFKPDIVIILVGGNDICDNSSPNDIVKNIKNLVDELKENAVQFIYVSEILPRGKFKYSVELTIERFNSQKKKINKKLQNFANASVISMKKIKYPEDYIRDCVHLNDSGQKKLFFNFRTVVLSTRFGHV